MSRVQLSRRVTLESKVRVVDGAGGYEESWTARGTLWAEIRPRSGRYANRPGGEMSVTGVKIIVRAAPEASGSRPVPGQRFGLGRKRYRIEAVTDLEPHALYLVCHCTEEVVP